jgi:hypothetical protein
MEVVSNESDKVGTGWYTDKSAQLNLMDILKERYSSLVGMLSSEA